MENVLFLSVANRNDVDNNNDDDNNDDDNINDDNNNDDDVASLFISKKAPKKFCYKIVGRENEAHHCRRSHRRRPQLQCDQIWLNFSTLAKFKKSLGNFCCGLISKLASVCTNFGNLLCYWANSHCCKWQKIAKLSGRLVTLSTSHSILLLQCLSLPISPCL